MWKKITQCSYSSRKYYTTLSVILFLIDVIINCISIYVKSFKNLSIQTINSTFIILYSFEQLSTYTCMSRTIIFINTSLSHFSTPFCLLEVSLVMGCNISSNPMSKFILSSHSAPKTILLLHIYAPATIVLPLSSVCSSHLVCIVSSNILKMTGSWTQSFFSYQLHKVNMVCPANSSYSFRATALIFCRMFIHIMDVCMSTGF